MSLSVPSISVDASVDIKCQSQFPSVGISVNVSGVSYLANVIAKTQLF